MRTVVALGGRMAVGIDVKRIVGTCLGAGLAADAAAPVEIHDAVRTLLQRLDRTDIHTGRLSLLKIRVGMGMQTA